MTFENYLSEVEREAARVEELVHEIPGLNSAQLNWRPSENSWSAGECFQHLIKINDYYIEHFKKAGEDPGKKVSELGKFKSTLGGKFVLRGVNPEQKFKAKTSREYNPINSNIDGNIIKKFLEQHQLIKSLAAKCRGADLNKVKIASPFTKLIRYNIGDAFMIVMLHNQRHILQAKRVMENPGFPGK